MSKLFASLGGEQRLVFSEREVSKVDYFEVPENINGVEFNNEQNRNDDEWFYIVVGEAHYQMVQNYIDNSNNTTGTNQISFDDFAKINSIYKVIGTDCIWQKITPSKNLAPKHILNFKTDNLELTNTPAGLEISENVDAYYKSENRRLFFRSFRRIKSLFDGIEDFYVIATEQEVNDFKADDFCKFDTDIKFGQSQMKMLKLALEDEDIDFSSNEFKQKVNEIAQGYPNVPSFENNHFVISTSKQLTAVLKATLGRYYKNPVTDKKMEASSARKVE